MNLLELRNLANHDAFPGRVTGAIERVIFAKVVAGTLTASETLLVKAAFNDPANVTRVVMVTVFNAFDAENPNATPADLYGLTDAQLQTLVASVLPYVLAIFYPAT